jgi:hypothetical protein
MPNTNNKGIQILDDIKFLLELCRDLIQLLRKSNPHQEIPINREQIAKLKSIEKKIH